MKKSFGIQHGKQLNFRHTLYYGPVVVFQILKNLRGKISFAENPFLDIYTDIYIQIDVLATIFWKFLKKVVFFFRV